MINTSRLIDKAAVYGIELDVNTADKIKLYIDILIEWNKKINLTAIKDAEDIENKHIIDSLLLAVQYEVTGTLVDVGSGAGFPGIIIKLIKPEISMILVEPIAKRARFLEEVCHKLSLDVEIINERAEILAKEQYRDYFSVATARAVAALPQLCEYCLPLVKPGGWFIAMKGPDEGERSTAMNAVETLGGRYEETRSFKLPDGSDRSLVMINKIIATPLGYPRNTAKISKKPL